MDATTGSDPPQASPAPFNPKGVAPAKNHSSVDPDAAGARRAHGRDTTKRIPPLLHPFPPDDFPSAAPEVLPLQKRHHRGLQQTCSAPHPSSRCTDALRHPPSPTSRPRSPRRHPMTHAARRQPAAVAASSRVSRLPHPRPPRRHPPPPPPPPPNQLPPPQPRPPFPTPPHPATSTLWAASVAGGRERREVTRWKSL